MSNKPLSPRHLRFVHEYLKDGNATQAYIRAGYSARHAQSCASRLLVHPAVEAALAEGRQHLAQALEVDVQRVGQEYAKIAFANIRDYVEVDADGNLRIDIAKASQAQSAGLVEVIVTHGKQSQTVRLKLGKLKALEMLTRHIGVFGKKPASGAAPEDRARLDGEIAALQQLEAQERSEKVRLQRELDDARRALREAQVEIDRARHEAAATDQDGSAPSAEGHPVPSDTPTAAQPMPGMPTEPTPDHTPGPYPNARLVWSGGRQPGDPPDSHEAQRRAMANHGNGR